MIRKYYKRDFNRKLSDALSFQILKSPCVTEKASILSSQNIVVLKVEKSSNKIDIKRAFEKVFELDVDKVRVINTKPKLRSFKGKWARRASEKKAMIFVKKGQDINKIVGVE